MANEQADITRLGTFTLYFQDATLEAEFRACRLNEDLRTLRESLRLIAVGVSLLALDELFHVKSARTAYSFFGIAAFAILVMILSRTRLFILAYTHTWALLSFSALSVGLVAGLLIQLHDFRSTDIVCDLFEIEDAVTCEFFKDYRVQGKLIAQQWPSPPNHSDLEWNCGTLDYERLSPFFFYAAIVYYLSSLRYFPASFIVNSIFLAIIVASEFNGAVVIYAVAVCAIYARVGYLLELEKRKTFIMNRSLVRADIHIHITKERENIFNLKGSKVRSAWHIEPSELTVGNLIGEGGFGEVYSAVWRGTPVAIKRLKFSSSQNQRAQIELITRELSVLFEMRSATKSTSSEEQFILLLVRRSVFSFQETS